MPSNFAHSPCAAIEGKDGEVIAFVRGKEVV